VGVLVSEQVDEIANMYEMPEDSNETEEIRRFVEEREHLFPILKEAKGQIISVFGNRVRLCLELYHDIEEGWDQLYIIIKSSYDTQKAIELDNRLAEEWFLDRMRDTKGDLNISEESS
jgi:hypothetical protein